MLNVGAYRNSIDKTFGVTYSSRASISPRFGMCKHVTGRRRIGPLAGANGWGLRQPRIHFPGDRGYGIREIHARHLANGAAILDSAGLLPEIAMKMTGNVPEYLMQALRNSILSHRGRAYALAVVAVLHKERGEDIPQASIRWRDP
jgi:hypothetical protein